MEHLEDRRFGTVVTVLGAAFGLGDPDRGAIVADRMVDVRRQQLIRRHFLTTAGDRTVHDEALVQAHQIADKRLLQQVVADRDARRRQAGVVHGVVDEGRVHDDIAVVGDEQIGAAGLELLDTGVGHAIGGALDGVVDVGLDLVLQRRHRSYVGELTT
ncbi:hypothetical protein D3C87_1625250 [compost metagenome]